jgi:hypothetical protein
MVFFLYDSYFLQGKDLELGFYVKNLRRKKGKGLV